VNSANLHHEGWHISEDCLSLLVKYVKA